MKPQKQLEKARLNEVTKTLTKNKNPKRVAAGKKLAEFNKKKRESFKKEGRCCWASRSVKRYSRNGRKRTRDKRALQGFGSSGPERLCIFYLCQLAQNARFTFDRNARWFTVSRRKCWKKIQKLIHSEWIKRVDRRFESHPCKTIVCFSPQHLGNAEYTVLITR